MYTRAQLENILVLDIETASVTPNYAGLSERFQELWVKKAALIARREEENMPADELYTERAAIFAEFGRVVCITCGYLRFQENGQPVLKLKSFSGPDEKQLLSACTELLDKFMADPKRNICAHNGKEFDFPYMGRRYLINQLPLPKIIAEIQSAKPWDVRLIDTMNLWKFGDFKSFTSLDLLCAALDIPSPKDDMDGSMVGKVFWEAQDHARIARYCEQDVIATAQVLLRMARLPLLAPELIQRAS
jgi:3'-5' exonuclease